jgi:hypothetical protein
VSLDDGGEWLPSQESNPPYVRLTAGRVHLARLMGIRVGRMVKRQRIELCDSDLAKITRCPQLAPNLVDQAGNDPAASSSPTRRSPFELLARAWSWFRATLPAPSTQCSHQISLPGVCLVRMPVIETGPDEWRSSARPSSYTRESIFRKKAAADFDPGRTPVFRRKCERKWWEVDGIEPLAKKDRVYSAATAPACPYLHFPNWRKREVLIPNGATPSISLRTSAGLLSGYVSVFGGRLSARCSYARGVPFALQAMPTP